MECPFLRSSRCLFFHISRCFSSSNSSSWKFCIFSISYFTLSNALPDSLEPGEHLVTVLIDSLGGRLNSNVVTWKHGLLRGESLSELAECLQINFLISCVSLTRVLIDILVVLALEDISAQLVVLTGDLAHLLGPARPFGVGSLLPRHRRDSGVLNVASLHVATRLNSCDVVVNDLNVDLLTNRLELVMNTVACRLYLLIAELVLA